MRVLVAFSFLACASASMALPAPGNYAVKFESFNNAGLEPLSGIKNRSFQVFSPSNSSRAEQFPLLVYAHGAAGGGIDMVAYGRHFKDLASYGFVVIVPTSCFMGCPGAKKSSSPEVQSPDFCYPQWPSFVYENTRAIEYAVNESAVGSEWASKIDWAAGVGSISHSMGGEVGAQMASTDFAKKYKVKAMVCEHCLACIKKGDLITTPALFFTGNGDFEVLPRQVLKTYNLDTATPKTYANAKGRGHTEMLNLYGQYNPAIARHTAAFMKVWLNGDRKEFYDIVYGTGPTSVCGYADMVQCEHDMGNSSGAFVV